MPLPASPPAAWAETDPSIGVDVPVRSFLRKFEKELVGAELEAAGALFVGGGTAGLETAGLETVGAGIGFCCDVENAEPNVEPLPPPPNAEEDEGAVELPKAEDDVVEPNADVGFGFETPPKKFV